MGKYDKDFAQLDKDDDDELTTSSYLLFVIANELAEANRLTRQKLCTKPGEYYDKEELVDKA